MDPLVRLKTSSNMEVLRLLPIHLEAFSVHQSPELTLSNGSKVVIGVGSRHIYDFGAIQEADCIPTVAQAEI